MKEIALLGPTASGKTVLAVEIAQEIGAVILSLDSLSIYKEIDIVSAKPTLPERGGIEHFGLDVLRVDSHFSAATFFDLYEQARASAQKAHKHLLITGGTGFYLKALIEGLSPRVHPSREIMQEVEAALSDLEAAYARIASLDAAYAARISPRDRYRIRTWHEIYLGSGLTATEYFARHTRKPLIESIDIYAIEIDRKLLRTRIKERTRRMIEAGAVEEVFALERRYGRTPNAMKAIGIKETLEYLDGALTLQQLHERITTHTAQLAKRQRTFNASQFSRIHHDSKENLKKIITDKYLN